MDLYQIDDDGRLFMSADLCDWSDVVPYRIDVVIDVDGGLDACIPTHSDQCLYIYFPFDDDDQILPSASKLRASRSLPHRSSRTDTACWRIAAWATTGRDSSRG